MTSAQAREIAIREVAVKVREIADTCERWRVNDHGYVPIAHELREAAAVLEAQANVEESRSVNRHAEVSRFYGDANRDASASESEAGTPQHIQANVEGAVVTLNVKASIRRCGCGKCGTGWLIIQGDDETAPHGFLGETDCPALASMKPGESIPVSITVGQANVEEKKAAFLEAAMAVGDAYISVANTNEYGPKLMAMIVWYRRLIGQKGDVPGEVRIAGKYLVEASRESASKKEDAGT